MTKSCTQSKLVRVLLASLLLSGTVAWGQGSIGTIIFARGEVNIEPVDPGDSFPAGIGEVYAFVEFENLEATDIVSANWFQGEESFASQATTLGQLLGASGRVPTGKIYFSVVFDPGAQPGVYRLEVSLNAQVVQSREFTVEEVVAGAGEGAAESGIAAAAGAIQPETAVPAEPGEAAEQPAAADQPAADQPAADQAEAQQPAGQPPVAQQPAQPAAPVGSFDRPGIAAEFAEGETISLLHHYPETLTDPRLVFAYRDVQPGATWGWRVSREGQLVAEQMGLTWEAQGEGLHSQALGVELSEGVYDVDLYLNEELANSSSVTVGEPVLGADRLLFADEFDDPGSGWGTASSQSGLIEYRDSRLMFTLNGQNAPAVSVHNGVFGDAIVEVEAATVAGPVDNALGIVARYQDQDNYYAFLVSADGYYAILHLVEGEPVWDQQWVFDGLTGVQMGMASNQLRVLSQGPFLRFYVNGALRGVVQDPVWQEGQVGVFAGVFDEPGVQVGFDNWRVWSLPSQ